MQLLNRYDNKRTIAAGLARLLLLSALISASVMAGGNGRVAVVRVDKAVDLEIAPFVWVPGTVIGRVDSRIAAEIEGNLVRVLDVGERVSKGAVIAKIEDTAYKLALNEISAEVRPIETMVAFYQREADRLAQLAMKNNAARNRLDETQANRDEAQAKIRAIKARMAVAGNNLNKTTVIAPFDGVIAERIKMPGERVEAGEPVVRLINTATLEIQARIRQASINYISAGEALRVKTDVDEAIGNVRTIIPVGDALSRLYEVRIDFNQAGWNAGMAVKVAIPIREKQSVTAVPRDALVIRQSGVVVYRINENNIAEPVPVKTGISNASHIQVIGNINSDDSIVVRGNERLRPGQPVQIISGSNS